jgi:hypothetical protein
MAVTASPALVFDVNETNSVCGDSFRALSAMPINGSSSSTLYDVVFTLPANGDLFVCQGADGCGPDPEDPYVDFDDPGAKIQATGAVSIRLFEYSFVYRPKPDYFNHRLVQVYSANLTNDLFISRYVVGFEPPTSTLPCTTTPCVDFYQLYIPALGIRQIHRIRVLSRSSVPTMRVNETVQGGIKEFANLLAYTDPDGDIYLTQFVFVSDRLNLRIADVIPDGVTNFVCEDTICQFTCVASLLKAALRAIDYNTFQQLVSHNRVKLSVAGKTEKNVTSIFDGVICTDTLSLELSKVFVYTVLIKNSLVPMREAIPYHVFDSGTIIKGLTPPSKGKIYLTGNSMSYVPFNPYDFSIGNPAQPCLSSYDKFDVNRTNLGPTSCFLMPNITVDVCVRDIPRDPRIPYITNVTDIYVGEPKWFKIDVFDANDFTVGLNDRVLSVFTYHDNASRLVGENAGVYFTRTRFATGEIRDGDYCETVLAPNRVYQTNVFCYMATDYGSFEYTTYAVTDSTAYTSNAAGILFEFPHEFYVCTTEETSGIEATECTSAGKETNTLYGTKKIDVAIYADDFSVTKSPFRIVIRSLPANGYLLYKGTTRRVAVGDEINGIYGRTVYFSYVGANDYFNYNIFDAKYLGGLAAFAYKECQDACKLDASAIGAYINCLTECKLQYSADQILYKSEYFASFVDRKNIPIGTCTYAEEVGCPDFFLFDVKTFHETIPDNRYNIYVSNVGSRFDFTVPSKVTYTTNEPAYFRMDYSDPDGDAWEVTVYIDTTYALLGSKYGYEIYVRNDSKVECFTGGVCNGKLFIMGLPSDIREFFANGLYIQYYAKVRDPVDAPMKVRVFKEFWGNESRAEHTVTLYSDYELAPNIANIDDNAVLPSRILRSSMREFMYVADSKSRNVFWRPPPPSIGDVLAIFFETILGFVIPVERIVGAIVQAVRGAVLAVPATAAASRYTYWFITEYGSSIVNGVYRLLRAAIGRVVAAISFIVRLPLKIPSAIRSINRFVRGKPRTKPQTPQAPITNTVQTDNLLATSVRQHPDNLAPVQFVTRDLPVARPGDPVPTATVGKAVALETTAVADDVTEIVIKSVITKTTYLGRARTIVKRDFIRSYNAIKLLIKKSIVPGVKLGYRLAKILKKILSKLNSLRKNLSKLLKRLKKKIKPRKRGNKKDDDDWFSIKRVKSLIRYMIKSELLTLAGQLLSSIKAKILAFFGLIGSALGLIKNIYDAYTRLNDYEKQLEQEQDYEDSVDDGDSEDDGELVETASNTTENDDSAAGSGTGSTNASKFNPCKCRWRC